MYPFNAQQAWSEADIKPKAATQSSSTTRDIWKISCTMKTCHERIMHRREKKAAFIRKVEKNNDENKIVIKIK